MKYVIIFLVIIMVSFLIYEIGSFIGFEKGWKEAGKLASKIIKGIKRKKVK